MSQTHLFREHPRFLSAQLAVAFGVFPTQFRRNRKTVRSLNSGATARDEPFQKRKVYKGEGLYLPQKETLVATHRRPRTRKPYGEPKPTAGEVNQTVRATNTVGYLCGFYAEERYKPFGS